jgi:hypothetical protein
VVEVPVGRQRFKTVVPGKGQLSSTGSDDLTDDNEEGFDAEAVHAAIGFRGASPARCEVRRTEVLGRLPRTRSIRETEAGAQVWGRVRGQRGTARWRSPADNAGQTTE